MEVQSANKEYTKEDVIRAFLSIEANILLNKYTNENVLFKRIKPTDKVPIKQYLDDLGFRNVDKYLNDLFLDGQNVLNGFVTERDFDKRCFEFYRDKIECIFDDVPIDKFLEQDDEDVFHYKYGLYEYIKGLYTIFYEIISTEIEPDLFTSVPDITDKEKLRSYYFKATKFIKAIKLKGLKQGGCVDRYVKDLPLISPFIRRLLVKRKGRFLLKNNDTNSLDYKLALLSCIRFYNEYNAKLFELKTLRFEELKRPRL